MDKIPQDFQPHSARISATTLACVIVLLGIFLRAYRLSFVTLWYDEFLTLQTVRLPLADIMLAQYSRDLHPPLYFTLLKLWMTLGNKELILRSFSLLSGAAILLLAYFIGKDVGGKRVGLAATIVLAFHPNHLYYSTEIRPYALLSFFVLLSFLALLRIDRSERHALKWLCILCIGITGALYTHYFGVLVFLFIAICSGIKALWRPTAYGGRVVLVLLLSGLFYAPLVLQVLIRQTQNTIETQAGPRGFFLQWETIPAILSATGAPSFSFTNPFHALSLIASLCGLWLLYKYGDRTLSISFLIFLIVAALTGVVLSTINLHTIYIRYLLPAYLIAIFPIACVFLPVASASGVGKVGRVAGCILLTMYLYQGVTLTLVRDYPHPDWREVAEQVQAISSNDERIVILGWDASPLSFYLPDQPAMTSYDLEGLVAEGNPETFIIVDSPYGRHLPLLDHAPILYEDKDEGVRILQYTIASPSDK